MTATPFLSDHLAHLLGAALIILAALIWLTAELIRWAGDVVNEHVERALNDPAYDYLDTEARP